MSTEADLSLSSLDERVNKIVARGSAGEIGSEALAHLVHRLLVAEGSVREVAHLAESMEREAPKPQVGGFIAETIRDALAKGARAAAPSVEASP